MKKYIKPQTETIELAAESIMAASPNDDLGNGLFSRRAADDNEDNMFAKGHSFSIWDEDEQERP